MTEQQLAVRLHERQYREEITEEEAAEAAKNRLVVVFGYSDDNMELRGAIDDEFGCYEGGEALVTRDGLLQACESNCVSYQAAAAKAKRIVAEWDKDGYSWVCSAWAIPGVAHFDILEGDDKFCQGIVFSLDRA